MYNYELTDLDISLRLGPLATSLKRMDVVPSPTAPEMLLDDCHALPSSKEAQLGVNLESSGADNKGHLIRKWAGDNAALSFGSSDTGAMGREFKIASNFVRGQEVPAGVNS